ncbi:hydrogenase large subunit [Variovorax sp. PBL-E5]|uniref:hydrogenase large subunit n=1 Tax=Variovorax sp. PBL-E5 TaxID=434014 RepID=UPI0013A5448E|nr:NADH-quinone oxidoreductase subunit C [Variovorax sp. PBL-E5]
MVLTREIAPLGLTEWADQCAQALGAGDRMITLFGRPDADDEVVITAILQSDAGRLGVVRGRAKRHEAFPSLTPRHPAVQMFERELWEQTGLTPVGHPWLKPVRYEGLRQQHMTEHPFFKVRGQEIHEVGVGPIHASVIEPGHFRFMCHGEQVHHLEIQLGYQHRGVEALLLRRPPLALASLVESIVGDSSVAYAWGYCAAVEALSGAQVTIESDLVRGVALELERVAMHLAGLTGLATDTAFLQGGATYGRLRTAVINASMRACGSRFGRGWLRPGGVRFGIADELRRDLLKTIAASAKDIAEINDLMLSARSIQSRFQGVGVVGNRAARDIGLVGLVGRASGIAVDMRVSLPGRLYTGHPVALLTEETGDCWARLLLRMREIDESLRWLTRVLETPDLDLMAITPVPVGPLWPDTLCVSVREGFRGPVVQTLETGTDGHLIHYKVQDPSLLNWFGVALALRDNEISDFPLCNKSFDLSYCGNDL